MQAAKALKPYFDKTLKFTKDEIKLAKKLIEMDYNQRMREVRKKAVERALESGRHLIKGKL